jgi:Protein of unknown function (DUF2442)
LSHLSYLPAVVGVSVVGDYRLRLLFDDGTAGDVDLSSMAWKGVFGPFRDPKYFATVKVDPEAGTVVWPNGVDLAPETLYQKARKNPVSTA